MVPMTDITAQPTKTRNELQLSARIQRVSAEDIDAMSADGSLHLYRCSPPTGPTISSSAHLTEQSLPGSSASDI